MSRLDGDYHVTGTLTAGAMVAPDNLITSNTQIKAGAGITRAKMAQVAAAVFPIPLASMRVWNTWQPLPLAATDDDLGAIAGTWATSVPHIESSDSGQTSVTQYLGFEFTLPDDYDEAETITVRIPAKMRVVADGSAAVDVEAYLSDGNALVSGGDLIATGSTTINSADWANKDFTVTATSRAPGDKIFFRVKVAIVDTNTATEHVTAWLGDIEVLVDVRG
jgi:hypothetical protein